MMSRTQVIMLGTGTPNADADRVSSGVVIAIDNRPYLVDCGHSIVQRVVQAHHMGKIQWDTSALTRLFVTHLHADHTVGLPDLMFTPWIHDRQEKIQAYGPTELETMVEHLLLAFSENIREHSTGHPISSREAYQVEVHPVSDGKCYEDELLSVYALKVDHASLTAYSYKFVTPDRIIVISGDTKPVPAFVDWATGCDTLIHEVYSSEMFKKRPSEWQTYHSSAHTSTIELAHLADQIQPDLLVLYHQLFWGVTPDELVAEITSTYNGSVVSANDLDIF
jgi:ribonuclease BN (tRNA processing enzyme)